MFALNPIKLFVSLYSELTFQRNKQNKKTCLERIEVQNPNFCNTDQKWLMLS